MSKAKVILPMVCCFSALSGCAYFESANIEPWSVKPTMTVRHSRENPEAMYQLGRYYQGQGQEQYEQAIAAYKKAISADNSYADANNGLAVVYWLQGKRAESIAEFMQAVEKAPGAARFHNNLEYAYLQQGRYGEAVATLQKFMALESDNKLARDNLRQAYAQSGVINKSSYAQLRMDDTLGASVAAIPVWQSAIGSATQQDMDTALETVSQDKAP